MNPLVTTRELSVLARAMAYIEDNFGLEFPEYKLQDLLEKLDQACVRLGYQNRDQLVAELAEGNIHHQDLDQIISMLIVDESYFFRHPEQIDLISAQILPILDQTETDTIRVWSAGCARGEEPYSLAIKHHLRLESLDHPVEIMGADLVESNLDQAREGRYSDWSLRDVPAHIIARYFQKEVQDYRLDPKIVGQVKFKRMNLAGPYLASPFGFDRRPHLIVCRNTLIYMSRERARRVIHSFLELLAPGGFVVLGPSESISELDPSLKPYDNILPYLYQSSGEETAVFSPMRPAPVPAAEPIPIPATMPEPPSPAPSPAEMSLAAATPLADVLSRAQALRDQGRWQEAVQVLDALPGVMEAQLAAIAILSGGPDPQTAAARCESFLRSFPDQVGGYYHRAMASARLGELEDALNWLRKALYLDPKFVSGHLQTALILQQLERDAESERAMRNVEKLLLAMDPDQEVPLTDGRKADEIFMLIRRDNP